MAVFIYWGWDSLVAVNEETEDKEAHAPGIAAVASTIILVLLIYVVVTFAAQAFARDEVPRRQLRFPVLSLGTAVLV